jgi:hypothetical protein
MKKEVETQVACKKIWRQLTSNKSRGRRNQASWAGGSKEVVRQQEARVKLRHSLQGLYTTMTSPEAQSSVQPQPDLSDLTESTSSIKI